MLSAATKVDPPVQQDGKRQSAEQIGPLNEDPEVDFDQDLSNSTLDLARTRQQLGLSDEFILELLRDFNSKYLNFEQTLREFLARSDFKGARIYIHTLAGLTGTIAADDLSQKAKELEASIAASEEDIDISSIVETHNRLRSYISCITEHGINMSNPRSGQKNSGDHP